MFVGLPEGTLPGNTLPDNVIGHSVFYHEQFAVAEVFAARVQVVVPGLRDAAAGIARPAVLHADGVKHLFVAVVVGLVGDNLDILAGDVEAAVTRAARLAELRREQVEEVLDVMVLVVKEDSRVGGVFCLHLLA